MMKRNLVWAGKGVGERNYDYGFAVSFFFSPEKQPPPPRPKYSPDYFKTYILQKL